MKIASCCCLLLVAAATVVMVTGTKINFEEYGTEEERAAVIQEAIAEAKEAAKHKEEATKAAAAQAERDGKYTSSQLLSKFFKRPSETAKKMGKAQLLYEAMVRKAERKLAEKHRQSHAASQSSKERAQELANEIFHRPGSMLTAQEIAHMWQESECIDARPVPSCNFATVSEFRTIDGTCNNLANPLFGAATTPFTRLVPAFYEDGVSSLRGELQARGTSFMTLDPFAAPNPSPRSVSDRIVDSVADDEMGLSHILMQWGQFLDHDLDLAPELEEECEHCEFTDICIPIRVADDDADFGTETPQDAECLSFRRSLPACDESAPGAFHPRELINDITSFIDGSMVYGSNDAIASAVRDTSDGLLRTGSGNSLPIDVDSLVACPNQQNCFLCGDVRCNEQISLTIMHTIWVREHNRIATALKALNSQWDDERLYQEARSIVGALIQKITYVDFLPKLLGTTGFNDFIGAYTGYDPAVDAGVPNSFAAAAYRFGHTLIRPEFARLDSSFSSLGIGALGLVDAFFDPSQFTTSGGTDPILRGLISEDARRLDEFLNDVLTSQLFQTGTSPGMDLATLNIQRGRDHGLPPYLVYRNFCNRIFEMTSDFENSLTLEGFLELYGTLDTVDLWIAGLAEDRLPGSLLGATFSCIFGITFANARSGDRFWYENPGVFTPSQVTALNSGSLSRVICDNADDIDMIQPDAFRSDQTRISCDDIPEVDLSQWVEESCYFRIRVRPRRYTVRISAFSRVDPASPFIFTRALVRRSSSRQFACVPTLCPTSTDPLDIVVFSRRRFQRSLDITADSDLPRDRLRRLSGAYRAEIPRSYFDSQTDGFFTSEQACDDSNAVAFDFDFPTRNNVEAELLALVEGAEDQEDDDDSNEPVDLPEDVLDIITNDPDGRASQFDLPMAAGNDEGHVVAEVSDESLMKELEKALEAMKN